MMELAYQPPPALTARRRLPAGRGTFAWSAGLWLLLIVCCGLPLLWLVAQIALHPASLRGLRMDPFRWALLGRTLGYNAVAAVLATLLGLPAALVLGRGRGVVAGVLWFCLPVTLLLPSIAYAYAWAQFVRLASEPAGRAVAAVLRPESPVLHWLGIDLRVAPVQRMLLVPAGRADVLRCVWSLATWLWALPAGVMGLALRRLDADLQQQATIDGALWRVTARQLLGPMVAGLACVTILAVQEFAVYEPTGISVAATEVRQIFQTGSFSSPTNPITAPGGGPWIGGDVGTPANVAPDALPGPDDTQRLAAAAAVTTALPLLLIVLALGGIAIWGVRRAAAGGNVEVEAWPATLNAGAVAKSLACLALVVTLVVPTATLIVTHREGYDFRKIWTEYTDQIIGSIFLAGLGGIAALFVAAAASVRRHRGLLALALVAFLIGGQLLAIALIRLYNRPLLSGWVYNAPPIMVMAYVARFGWLVLLAAGATWSRPWRTLRDMAAVDGAGPGRTALHVVWPLAWPLLVAATLLVLVLSLTEVPATVLIQPLRPQSIIPMLMTWVHIINYDSMIEASLLLMTAALGIGSVAAGLLWIGVRGRRIEDRRWRIENSQGGRPAPRAILYPLSSILTLLLVLCTTGCGPSKEPEAVWCETGTAPGQVVYPRAIAYAPRDDSFFIIDRVAHVQHLDRKGNYLGGWQMPEWQYGKPVGVSVGPDGNVYVPDTHYHRVMVYTPDGRLLRQWGKEGSGDGEFIFPTDVAFDDQGRIFVSEYGGNDRIQVFDRDAKLLYQFGHFGNGDGQFSRPQSMVIDKGLLYVTDASNHRICVFRTDGTFVRNMGRVGSELGQFRFPYGLDMDAEGRLIVCEFGNNRVQRVDKETGRGLATWGHAGRDPGQLAYPWGVAVDKHDRVVAVDAGNNRFQVFEF
jgi:ABC-type Fe3+ transport system permease subunit/sugar lactone lactonase YvrE